MTNRTSDLTLAVLAARVRVLEERVARERFGGTDTAEDRARLWQDRVDDDEPSPVRGEPGPWRRLFVRLGALLSSSRGR